jgi:hypothetical protein
MLDGWQGSFLRRRSLRLIGARRRRQYGRLQCCLCGPASLAPCQRSSIALGRLDQAHGLPVQHVAPAYTYLRDHSSSLGGLIAFRAQPLNVSAGGTTERLTGMQVSGNYFDVLGVGMAAGSPIRTEDDQVPVSGGARGLVVVLSHQYWQRRFNGSAAVVGTSVRINGHPFTIVEVAPPGFHGTLVESLPDVFVPMMFAAHVFNLPNWLSNPRNNWLRIIARIKPRHQPRAGAGRDDGCIPSIPASFSLSWTMTLHGDARAKR